MLTKRLQALVEEIIRKSFNGFRLNLLGPDRVNKAFVLSLKGSKYDPNTSIGSAYLHANALNTTDPRSIDRSTIDRIRDVAEKYVNQLEEKSVADIIRIIGNHSAELENQSKLSGESVRALLLSDTGEEIIKNIKKELTEQKKRIDSVASTIAEHELYNAQNYGAFDGVLAAAKAIGISDPTVIKIGILDDKRCKHCWRLWTMPDQITPKTYKLSELQASPGHWKNPEASVSPTHPNCRDVLVTIMPGFGLVGGKITYMGIDPDTKQLWDEYSKQRR